MADAPSVVLHANNRNVSRYMTADWYPYSLDNAVKWLSYVLDPATPDHSFAIEVNGESVGSIGLILPEGPSLEGEVGYWLGEPFWGRGIATDALRAMVEHAFTEHGLVRLKAVVFAPNVASVRVLEKVGFALERVVEGAAVRDGIVLDDLVYGLVR
jgi:ribosomal-protein-alanine N-acetyltransferase